MEILLFGQSLRLSDGMEDIIPWPEGRLLTIPMYHYVYPRTILIYTWSSISSTACNACCFNLELESRYYHRSFAANNIPDAAHRPYLKFCEAATEISIHLYSGFFYLGV